MSTGLEHLLNRVPWQYFGTPTFRRVGTDRQLVSRVLRLVRVASRELSKPFDDAVFFIRLELGEINGRPHGHFGLWFHDHLPSDGFAQHLRLIYEDHKGWLTNPATGKREPITGSCKVRRIVGGWSEVVNYCKEEDQDPGMAYEKAKTVRAGWERTITSDSFGRWLNLEDWAPAR